MNEETYTFKANNIDEANWFKYLFHKKFSERLFFLKIKNQNEVKISPNFCIRINSGNAENWRNAGYFLEGWKQLSESIACGEVSFSNIEN